MGVKKYKGSFSTQLCLKFLSRAQIRQFRRSFVTLKSCTFGAHFRRPNSALLALIYCISGAQTLHFRCPFIALFDAHFATEPKILPIDSEPEAIRSHRRRRLALDLQRMKNATISFATVHSAFSANEFFTVGKAP